MIWAYFKQNTFRLFNWLCYFQGLNGTKDGFLQDMEMTDSYEAQNRFHEDINDDLKKETEDS